MCVCVRGSVSEREREECVFVCVSVHVSVRVFLCLYVCMCVFV